MGENTVADTVHHWDVAARTSENPQAIIHPAGVKGAIAYSESGRVEADHLVDLFRRFSLRPECPACGGSGEQPEDHGGGHIELLACQACRFTGVEGGGEVLEFGCGDGRILLEWPRGWARYGADASAAMLEAMAGRMSPMANSAGTFLWDGTAPLSGGRTFDVVYAVAVLIHQPHDPGMAMAGRLAELVKPGGLLLLGHPLYSEPSEGTSWIDVTTWTGDDLEKVAAASGLEVVESWVSPGRFVWGEPLGAYHGATQVLRRPA